MTPPPERAMAEWLRSLMILDEVGSNNPRAKEAAAMLEAALAEVDRLTEALAAEEKQRHFAEAEASTIDAYQAEVEQQMRRAESAEAALKLADEALIELATAHGCDDSHEEPTNAAIAAARARREGDPK